MNKRLFFNQFPFPTRIPLLLFRFGTILFVRIVKLLFFYTLLYVSFYFHGVNKYTDSGLRPKTLLSEHFVVYKYNCMLNLRRDKIIILNETKTKHFHLELPRAREVRIFVMLSIQFSCQPLRFFALIAVTAETWFWFVVDAVAQPVQWMVRRVMRAPSHSPCNAWYVHVHTNYWHDLSIRSDQSRLNLMSFDCSSHAYSQ